MKKRVSKRKSIRRSILAMVLASVALPIWSEPIDENTALKVAAQQLSRLDEMHGSSADSTLRKAPAQPKTLQLLYKSSNSKSENANSIMRVSQTNETVYFYVFGTENNDGFVIVSGDDRVIPVLGYSDTNGFNVDNMPENLKWWLGEYAKQIQFAIDNNIEPTQEVKQLWEQYLETKKAAN
jgi:hypothetical protein